MCSVSNDNHPATIIEGIGNKLIKAMPAPSTVNCCRTDTDHNALVDAGCACLAHAGTGHVHFEIHIRTKTRGIIIFHKCKECARLYHRKTQRKK